MSRWFRMYDEILDDPKVQRLDGADFKLWVNLLCLASRNNGRFGNVSETAFSLRMDESGALAVIERLLSAGLIDKVAGGGDGWHYAPHSWGKRQYKSDTSSDRVKRYRERSKSVSETPPETDTETDITVSKDTAQIDPDKVFWDSAKSYLGASKASLIGKWVGQYSKPVVMSAIASAQSERAVDPVQYITGVLRKSKNGFSQPRIPI